MGTLSAITANTGNLNVSGQIKANTATLDTTNKTIPANQSGAFINSAGQFVLGRGFITGDGTIRPKGRNIYFDGTDLIVNGDLIVTNNIQAANISSSYFAANGSTVGFTTPNIELLVAQTSTFTVPDNFSAVRLDFSLIFINNTTNNKGMTFSLYRGTTLVKMSYIRMKAGVEMIVSQIYIDAAASAGNHFYRLTASCDDNTNSPNLQITAGNGFLIATVLKR